MKALRNHIKSNTHLKIIINHHRDRLLNLIEYFTVKMEYAKEHAMRCVKQQSK